MGQSVVYATKTSFMHRIPTNTINSILCDDAYAPKTRCLMAGSQIDPQTGHRVCSECELVLRTSGLRLCDICEYEYINLNKYQNSKFETNCPRCVIEHGIEE